MATETLTDDPDRARTIQIVDYDPAWPHVFDAKAAALRATLRDAACGVEHVGSTSVPGLAAKPVIDIHLIVPDSADEAAYRPQVEALGYRLVRRDPDWFEHRLFKGQGPETNLHVFSLGCPEIDRCRLFRDWLRQSAADRMLYAGVKRKLSRRTWAHVQDYADAKSEVVAQITARAQAWQARDRT